MAAAESYKLYLLNEAGGISAPPILVSAMNDADAIAEAKRLNSLHHCELWIGPRMVASIAPNCGLPGLQQTADTLSE